MKRVDVLLAIIIIASLGFIAFRTFQQAPVSPITASNKLPSGGQVPMRLSAAPRPRPPLWFLEQLKNISITQWNQILVDSQLQSFLVEATKGCSQPGRERGRGLYLVRTDLAKKMAMGELPLSINSGDFTCYQKGETIALLAFDLAPTSLLVENIGIVHIDDIVQAPLSQFSESFFSALGANRNDIKVFFESYDSDTQSAKSIDPNFFIMYLTEARPAANPRFERPPAAFPTADIVKYPEIMSRASKKIVDVRSATEFGRYHIQDSINAPLTVSGTPPRFDPAITVEAVGKMNFPIADLLPYRDSLIVVIGQNPDDPRPFYALSRLFRLGFKRLAWIYEGVDSIPQPTSD